MSINQIIKAIKEKEASCRELFKAEKASRRELFNAWALLNETEQDIKDSIKKSHKTNPYQRAQQQKQRRDFRRLY